MCGFDPLRRQGYPGSRRKAGTVYSSGLHDGFEREVFGPGLTFLSQASVFGVALQILGLKCFSIAPVKLNLKDKDPELVGLGSYIVNAQGGCNDCHTCPSYAPGQVVLFAFPGIRRSSALGKSTIQLLEISRALWLARFPG